MKRSIVISIIGLLACLIAVLTVPGCPTLHADLQNEQMRVRVKELFDSGMTPDEVESILKPHADEIMHFHEDSEADAPTQYQEGDFAAVIWPRGLLFFSDVTDYYFRDLLLFRFGGDQRLDDVVWRSHKWNENAGDPYIIELATSEVTP